MCQLSISECWFFCYRLMRLRSSFHLFHWILAYEYKVCAKRRGTVWQTPSSFLYFRSDRLGSLRINSYDYVGHFQSGPVRKQWLYHSENEEGNLATMKNRISRVEKSTLVNSLILDRLIFHIFPPQNLLLFHLWAFKEGPCFFLTFRSYKPVSFIAYNNIIYIILPKPSISLKV